MDDPARKLFLNRKEVAGTLAMWAVRQSPYPVPDRLADAVRSTHDALPEELDGWFWATGTELRTIVEDICLNDPIIGAWNVPKSGHTASMVFSSRYDRPAADDDFIDLHALANNVCRSLVADQEQYFCDSGSDPQGENAGTAVECAASQSGAATDSASPETPHVLLEKKDA